VKTPKAIEDGDGLASGLQIEGLGVEARGRAEERE
jgi:hypothetical protein